MTRLPLRPIALTVLGVLITSPSAMAEPPKTLASLREQVLAATSSREKADAYKKIFQKVGRAELGELMKDEYTGIALQAAWESHRKPIERPMLIPNRADDVYDPAELQKFVTFLKDRTKAPVPDWWAETIVGIDLFPGRHHAFI